MKKNLLCLLINCLMIGLNFQTIIAQEKTNTSSEEKIMVGPNILVSKEDSRVPHAETWLAINPTDSKNLLGTSIVFTQYVGTTCKTYASKDGGYTWVTTSFPERINFGSADPQVAFGTRGIAYFLMLSSGDRSGAIHIYRSKDGGFTWQPSNHLRGADHPQMVVDQSVGRFAGRVYITAMHGVRRLGITRSEDDGENFTGPVITSNPKKRWMLNLNPLVFKDGTLFVPYLVWENQEDGKPLSSVFIEAISSTDGGITFSKPMKVAEMPFRSWEQPKQLSGSFVSDNPRVTFAIDSRNDNLYVAWNDRRTGSSRLFLSFSKDKGRTWNEPQMVSSDVPAWSAQYQPILAVNGNGIIGVGWFDTRDSKEQDRYNLYFTASSDGGKSFPPSKKVSSESSFPISSANLRPYRGNTTNTEEAAQLGFRTGFGRWGDGGDYMGLTADKEGTFHPFWIDSRNKVFQVYTAQIRVVKPDQNRDNIIPSNLQMTSLNTKIQLIVDPTEYNYETQEAIIPIRLKNISDERLFAPISLKVKELKGLSIPDGGKDKNGLGVVYDYTPTLGDYRFLEPGAITEPLIWKFEYTGLEANPTIKVDITGFVSSVK